MLWCALPQPMARGGHNYSAECGSLEVLLYLGSAGSNVFFTHMLRSCFGFPSPSHMDFCSYFGVS